MDCSYKQGLESEVQELKSRVASLKAAAKAEAKNKITDEQWKEKCATVKKLLTTVDGLRDTVDGLTATVDGLTAALSTRQDELDALYVDSMVLVDDLQQQLREPHDEMQPLTKRRKL
eukprot:974279-Rhodomonas_salina.2